MLDAIEASGSIASLATMGQVEVLTGPASAGDATGFEAAADGIRSLGFELAGSDGGDR